VRPRPRLLASSMLSDYPILGYDPDPVGIIDPAMVSRRDVPETVVLRGHQALRQICAHLDGGSIENAQNRLPSSPTAVRKNRPWPRKAYKWNSNRLTTMSALRVLTAACSTVELLRNGSPEF
jgi:hypothetical protein